MDADNLKTEVLLELTFCVESKDTDDEVINSILPIYIRKLNCFMIGIIRKDNSNLMDKQILPYIFKNDKSWQFLKDYISNSENNTPLQYSELVYNQHFYYIYKLSEYGFFVLGRKKPFENAFKNEFCFVVNFLGKTLTQSIEDNLRKEAEKKLVEERKLLRTIIDNIPINIYAKDLEYRKTLANLSELKHLGNKTESEVLGKTDFDLYSDDIAKNTFIEDQQVIKFDEPILGVEKHVSKDRWALISKLPLKNEEGEITGLVGISIDYTERKKTQEQLSVFLNLFDNISDAVQVNTEDGQLFYLNKIASERLGIPLDKVQDYKVTDYLVIFPTLEAWKTHCEELKSMNFMTSEGVNKNQKTGQSFPVEVTVKYVDITGKGFIVAISRDISQRKKVEIALQESEEKFRLMTENSSDVIWHLDSNYICDYISPADERMRGYKKEEALGKPLWDLLKPEGVEHVKEVNAKRIADEKNGIKTGSIHYELEQLCKDGSWIWTEANSSVHYNERGEIVGYHGITRDITARKQIEDALRKSEERKASLIASMSDIVYVLDNDLVINEYHMPENGELILDPQPYLNRPFDDIPLPQPAKSIIKDALVSCIQSRKFTKVEYYLETPKNRIWFELHATVLNDQHGVQSGTTCIIRDITYRKQHEELIRKQLKMQEILIKISSVYININLEKVESTIQSSLNELGEFVGADRAYIYDYDFVNNTTSNTYEWCSDGVEPEIDISKDIPLDEIPFSLEKHLKGEELHIDNVSALTDDGQDSIKSKLEPQGLKSIISIPMMSMGKLLGFVGFDSVRNYHSYSDEEKKLLEVFSQMLVNVRERKRSGSLLMLQEEKYRNIISNMNLGIIEVDKDENILYANQSFCNISGYSNTELLTMKTLTFLYSLDDKQLLDSKLKNRENGISDSYELAIKNKNGEQRWWFVSGAPNYNDNNELIGSIGIHLDITNQKKLEKELEQAIIVAQDASKAKEVFLANMSHEIRTPLNVITGMVRELGKESLTERQKSYVNHSETAAYHLLTIVNNILDMSKIEAGEFELDNKDFSISAVASDVQSILYSKANDKNIELKVHESPDIKRTLIGDAGRLRQILINLMGNALKFTESGFVELKITVRSTNKYYQRLIFEINDTGIGMSEVFLNKLFDKFSQEHGESNRKFEGTGLGMSITKELVQLMGGSISAKSQKGIGTNISFELNLPIGDDSLLVNKNTTKVEANCFEGIRVLLVEDNEMNRFIAIQSLKFVGCVVIEAENGFEAIKQLSDNEFDLVLMDIQMPEMDGVEATKQIRNTLRNQIPIIALTANAFKHDIDLYLSVGMNDYLIKPYREEDLYRKIEIFTKSVITSEKSDPIPEIIEPLYDLKDLIEISRGDKAFINKMLEVFLIASNQAIVQFRTDLDAENVDGIRKLAHKIKPSLDNMGIVGLKDKIRIVERYGLDHAEEVDLKVLVTDVCDILERVINDIKRNENL